MKNILMLVSILVLLNCAKGKPSEVDMTRIKMIYESNCSSCHGVKGYGDGVAAASFTPPPRNFHLPTQKWVNGKTKSGVEKTLTEGIMPNMWAYHGDKKDIPLLAEYVIYLGSVD